MVMVVCCWSHTLEFGANNWAVVVPMSGLPRSSPRPQAGGCLQVLMKAHERNYLILILSLCMETMLHNYVQVSSGAFVTVPKSRNPLAALS